MNVLIQADGIHITTERAAEIAHSLPDVEIIEAVIFDGARDIYIAHDILDTKNRAWIATSIQNTCPDLVARALLSTEGMIIQAANLNADPMLPKHTVYLTKYDVLPFILPKATKNEGPGTGNWNKDVFLIVGERPGKSPSLGERDATFFSVNASSQWLRSEIFKLGFTAENFYFVNAFNRGTGETDWEFIDRLQPKKIFALGKVASNSLSKSNVEHVALPHPQFWKRFHSKKEYPLTQHLRDELLS